MKGCVFCSIVRGESPATVLEEWSDCICIVPLGPVVPGHVLIIPRRHVVDFADDAIVSEDAMFRASIYAAAHDEYEQCNLITSRGPAATQTIFHLHVHLVPRQDGDGLALPWTGQHAAR